MPLSRQRIQRKRLMLRSRPNEGAGICWEEIRQFLPDFEQMNRSEETIRFYRRKIKRFYENLPEDKTVSHGTLKNWWASLLANGYALGTVNIFLPMVNAYLDYIGHRKYRLAGRLKEEKPPSSEMSQAKYPHLLWTAKSLGKERVYLLACFL